MCGGPSPKVPSPSSFTSGLFGLSSFSSPPIPSSRCSPLFPLPSRTLLFNTCLSPCRRGWPRKSPWVYHPPAHWWDRLGNRKEPAGGPGVGGGAPQARGDLPPGLSTPKFPRTLSSLTCVTTTTSTTKPRFPEESGRSQVLPPWPFRPSCPLPGSRHITSSGPLISSLPPACRHLHLPYPPPGMLPTVIAN